VTRSAGDSSPQPDLVRSLLSSDDIENVPGSPDDLVRQPVEDASLFENPDPRGPCGAEVTQPDFADAAISVFGTPEAPHAFVTQAVWDLPAGVAQEFLEEERADLIPGCPPYTSETPFGEQRVELLGEVALPQLEADALAIRLRIRTSEGPTLYAGSLLVRKGSRLSNIGMFAENPVSEAFIRSVASLVSDVL
jgi:hypothetical protein